MKILIITHSYTPDITPRSIRWSSIARYWVSQGHAVDVVCSRGPGLLRKEIIDGVTVYRVGGVVIENLRGRFHDTTNRISRKEIQAKGNVMNAKRSVIRLARAIHDMTWKKIYWPDYACPWYYPASKKAVQLFENSNYNCLISVSPPFTGHLVGLAVKKRFSNINWMVDCGDPFSFMDMTPVNNLKLYGILNRWIEKKIFKLSSSISVTTERTAMRYYDIYPDIAQKIRVISPVIDENFRNDCIKQDNTRIKNKIILSYYGNLYVKIRQPDRILQCLLELVTRYPMFRDAVVFNFYGDPGSFRDTLTNFQEKNGIIVVHGKVSRDIVMRSMCQSDFLINIGNVTDYQLPSKVVEYMSIGKPIINFSEIENDSSMEILREYPLVYNVRGYEKIQEQIPGLAEFLDKNRGVTLSDNEIDKLTSIFKIDYISKEYLSLVGNDN